MSNEFWALFVLIAGPILGICWLLWPRGEIWVEFDEQGEIKRILDHKPENPND